MSPGPPVFGGVAFLVHLQSPVAQAMDGSRVPHPALTCVVVPVP